MKYDCTSLAGQYFASIMIIVGMSVVATVVVLQYHHHDPNGGNMPKWVSLSLLHLEHIIISIDRAFQLLSVTQMAALLSVTDDVWAFINLSLSSSAPPCFHPSVGGTCAIVCQLPILKFF